MSTQIFIFPIENSVFELNLLMMFPLLYFQGIFDTPQNRNDPFPPFILHYYAQRWNYIIPPFYIL